VLSCTDLSEKRIWGEPPSEVGARKHLEIPDNLGPIPSPVVIVMGYGLGGWVRKHLAVFSGLC
jgi:hypothetical protein